MKVELLLKIKNIILNFFSKHSVEISAQDTFPREVKTIIK